MVERAAHELAALASAAHRVHHRLEPPAQQRRQRGEAVVGQVRNRGEDKHEGDQEEGDRQARGPVSETSPVWPASAAQPSLRAARGTIWRRQRRPPGEEQPAWFSAYFHPGEASTA